MIDTQIKNKIELHRIITEFVPILIEWHTSQYEVFRNSDFYDINYDENYMPAVGAVILSRSMNFGLINKNIYKEYITRAGTLLISPSTRPFQKVFLMHYTCLSILILPETYKDWAIQLIRKNLNNYIDNCEIFNTNCAAMKLVNRFFIDQLGIKPLDCDEITHLINFLKFAQLNSGFINDDVTEVSEFEKIHKDGMPIAYHAFIIFILITGLNYIKLTDKNFIFLEEIKKIVSSGMTWLANSETDFGEFAMSGRSKYHLFTRGIICAIHAYNNNPELLDQSLKNFQLFLTPDGSYNVTLNYFPHSLRVGYEDYAKVGMYNSLSIASLVISLNILENRETYFGISLKQTKQINNQFCDYLSGYVFCKKENNFFGINLIEREIYTHPSPMGLFHLRINGANTPIPEPYYDQSKPFSIKYLNDHIIETMVIQDENGNWAFPSFRNIQVSKKDLGCIELVFENEQCYGKKIIEIDKSELKIIYDFETSINILKIMQLIPINISDGMNHLRMNKISDRTINLLFGSRNYQLTCPQAMTLDLLPDRSLKSVSGVVSRFQFLIHPPNENRNTFFWEWKLENLGISSPEIPLSKKLDFPDPFFHIKNLKIEKKKDSNGKVLISIKTDAFGDQLEYAWYVLERIKKGYNKVFTKWYSKENVFLWSPDIKGRFLVQAFIKDKNNYRTSIIWPEMIDVD